MGIRTTSFYGLSSAALEYLQKNGEIVPKCTCDKCGHTHGGNLVQIGTGYIEGMYDEKIPLYSYFLKDGTLVSEVLQEEVWCSGPCIFTRLRLENGSFVGEWTEDEIGSYIS